MTKADELRALAERVCALGGPDREVDEAIARVIGWQPDGARVALGIEPTWWYTDAFGMPLYTASLDAAASLVPEGSVWLRKSPETMSIYTPPADEKVWARHIDAKGATPALALTAASLRARAEMEEGK